MCDKIWLSVSQQQETVWKEWEEIIQVVLEVRNNVLTCSVWCIADCSSMSGVPSNDRFNVSRKQKTACERHTNEVVNVVEQCLVMGPLVKIYRSCMVLESTTSPRIWRLSGRAFQLSFCLGKPTRSRLLLHYGLTVVLPSFLGCLANAVSFGHASSKFKWLISSSSASKLQPPPHPLYFDELSAKCGGPLPLLRVHG